jgi:hypothetical protein
LGEKLSYRWINVTMDAAFTPRDGAGALVFDGRMWLIGGWFRRDKVNYPRICRNDVWCSVDGKTWECVKPNTFIDDTFDPLADWEGRHTAGYVVHDGSMWIVGGDMNQGHYQNDVWRSSDGARWELVNSDVPWGGRGLQHVAAFNGAIWVMGGQTMPGFVPGSDTVLYNDVWRSTDGIEWSQVGTTAPMWAERGMIGGNCVLNDRIWILGGGTYETPHRTWRDFFNDAWSSADGIHWEQHIEAAPWQPRQYHEVAAFDGKMWVMEGWDGSNNRNDVWYSPDGSDWTELPDTPWAPRHAASTFVHDDALWMVTGNNFQSDVWKLVRD